MFRQMPAGSLPGVEQPPTHAALPEPVPLSVLELDHPQPDGGWRVYLHERNIPVGEDDLGRPAIARVDARQLLAEQRKAEARRREVEAARERAAVEQDRVKFASIWKGLAADDLPVGVAAGDAMIAAARAGQPKRRTVLEESLSNSPTMAYHAFTPNPDEE
jgi:hypothetical protein